MGVEGDKRVLKGGAVQVFSISPFYLHNRTWNWEITLPLEGARMDQFALLSFEKNSFCYRFNVLAELKCRGIEGSGLLETEMGSRVNLYHFKAFCRSCGVENAY